MADRRDLDPAPSAASRACAAADAGGSGWRWASSRSGPARSAGGPGPPTPGPAARTRRQPDYLCQRAGIEHATPICQSIRGASIDTAIGGLLISALTPLAIEAALTVAAELENRASQADALRAAHVDRARYHADLARHRYLAVDPANRLVAGTLEADWNIALRNLADAQDICDRAREQQASQLTGDQQARIRQLITDFPAIWDDPATPQRERKRMIRLLIADATLVKNHSTITAYIRLRGGQDTTLTVPIPKSAPELRKAPPDVITTIDQLLDQHTHDEIAGILGDRGLTTGEGRSYNRLMVRNVRDTYHLRSRYQRLRDAGLLTLQETAAILGVSAGTVKIWYHAGIVSGQQYNDKGQFSTTRPAPTPRSRTRESRSPAQTPEGPRPAETVCVETFQPTHQAHDGGSEPKRQPADVVNTSLNRLQQAGQARLALGRIARQL